MRALVTSSMIASILPKSSPLELPTVSPSSVAASMTSGPGPSERRRSAPTMGAPPVGGGVPVVVDELIDVAIGVPHVTGCESDRPMRVSTKRSFAEPRSLELLESKPDPHRYEGSHRLRCQ